jgi:serine/threonine protein kinase
MSPQQSIAHYRIVSKLGEGGMGAVYRATDTKLNRDVAIKILPETFAVDPDRLARFTREAQVLASLNHPNIASIYGVEDRAIIMELVGGPDLAGPLPPETALPLIHQLIDALEYAHEKGVVHRDLKPANIKITPEGRLKILDFGLAKALSGDQATSSPTTSPTLTMRATQMGIIMGTAAYMAPEQARGQVVDKRADIWAFGVVLYEMLTARQLFAGATVSDTLAAVLTREPEFNRVPVPMQRLVRSCLVKDARMRVRDIGDARLLLAESVPDAPQDRKPSLPRFAWGIFTALTLTLIAMGLLLWRRLPPSETQVIRFQIDPPEGGQFVFGNNRGGIAMSPDGRTVAFAASVGGKVSLWARPLDATAARQIPGTAGASYPFWSPDSKSIAFFASNKLQRVDLAGDTPFTVCDVAGGRSGVWTRDGRLIYGLASTGLFQVPATGGTPSLFTNIDASREERVHDSPVMLPGGRFLFLVQSDKAENSGIFAASLAKPAERVRLLNVSAGVTYAPNPEGKGHLLWLRGATLVAQEIDPETLKLSGEPQPVADPVAATLGAARTSVAASDTGVLLYSPSYPVSQFTWLDRAGGHLGTVGEPGEFAQFRISPDGLRLVASRTGPGPGAASLWMLDVDRGIGRPFAATTGKNQPYPVWSPDGRTIVFPAGPKRGLFLKAASGAGAEERITESPNPQNPTDWSRDGRWILYYELTPGSGTQMWVLPVTPDGKLAPGGSPKPYLPTKLEGQGRFSPESSPRWVAYRSIETGRYEIYIQAFPEPRGPIRISTAGGQYPEWGPDGHELFYQSPDNKLMVASLKFNADSVQPSAPRELFTIPSMDMGWSPFDVAPDGKRFLIRATPGQMGAPLNVIVNWPALLKKEPAQ